MCKLIHWTTLHIVQKECMRHVCKYPLQSFLNTLKYKVIGCKIRGQGRTTEKNYNQLIGYIAFLLIRKNKRWILVTKKWKKWLLLFCAVPHGNCELAGLLQRGFFNQKLFKVLHAIARTRQFPPRGSCVIMHLMVATFNFCFVGEEESSGCFVSHLYHPELFQHGSDSKRQYYHVLFKQMGAVIVAVGSENLCYNSHCPHYQCSQYKGWPIEKSHLPHSSGTFT